MWLEYHYELNPDANERIFACSGLDDPIQIKMILHYQLPNFLRGDEFVMEREGLFGTFAQSIGCTKVRSNCLLSLCLTNTLTQFSVS